VKHSLRSPFAVLLAALALACAGLGARGGDGTGAARAHGPMLRQPAGIAAAVDMRSAMALAFLHGGGPALAGHASRPGTPSRVLPGALTSGFAPFSVLHASRALVAGAYVHPPLRPPFARRLAAARDGTLSARSTGVPPPPLA